jgi:TQXA domain-containing protein
MQRRIPGEVLIMIRDRRTRLLALMAVAVSLFVAGFARGSATASGVSGTISAVGSGGTVSINGGTSAWAGLIRLDVDSGPDLETYCIDLHTPTSIGVHYNEGTWSEANVTNLGKVTWVLRHGYPAVSLGVLQSTYGLGSLTAAQAASATQAAVWHFSDGASLDASNAPNVVALYQALVATATSDPEPSATLGVTPNHLAGTVGSLIGPFTVSTTGGTVAVDATVGTITDADGNPIATVGDGDSFWVVLDQVGTTTIHASTSAVISSGRVFLTTAGSAKQKLITANTTTTYADVEVTAAATEPPTTEPPTTEPPTTEPPTTEPPTTEPPTTEPPTTEPPTTEPPTTEPPTTEPPTTEPPTTEPPTTEPPTTEPPTTEPPTTEPPTTEPPTTEPPTTEPPTTEPPTTEPPTTEPPTTEPPTTEPPTTEPPTTEPPTTEPPTTEPAAPPTTVDRVSQGPTTSTSIPSAAHPASTSSQRLPVTGGDYGWSSPQVLLGAGLALGGVAMVLAARRRQETEHS